MVSDKAALDISIRLNKARCRTLDASYGFDNFELARLAVMVCRCSVRISAETSTILTDVSHYFPLTLQTVAGIVPQSGYSHFLLNLLEFIIRLTSFRSILRNVATASERYEVTHAKQVTLVQ
jgi:hypothetical protein